MIFKTKKGLIDDLKIMLLLQRDKAEKCCLTEQLTRDKQKWNI